MIVREFQKSPFTVINNFDWFNDFDDTYSWLKGAGDTESAALLKAGHDLWLKKRNAAFNSTKTT